MVAGKLAEPASRHDRRRHARFDTYKNIFRCELTGIHSIGGPRMAFPSSSLRRTTLACSITSLLALHLPIFAQSRHGWELQTPPLGVTPPIGREGLWRTASIIRHRLSLIRSRRRPHARRHHCARFAPDDWEHRLRRYSGLWQFLDGDRRGFDQPDVSNDGRATQGPCRPGAKLAIGRQEGALCAQYPGVRMAW